MDITDAIGYVVNLSYDNPNFSKLSYYFHTFEDETITHTLFMSDIEGDWDNIYIN